MIDLSGLSSPQGLRFRSRPSLHAFLLQNEELNLDINLFDFTALKGDEVIFPTQVKQRRTRKKNARLHEAPEYAAEIPELSFLTTTNDKKVKSSVDLNCVNHDITKEEILHVPEVQVSSCTMDDVPLQKSPKRVGLLREKLLRLAPSSNQQNTLIVNQDEQVDSIQTLNTEHAAKSEDERKGGELKIHSAGGSQLGSVAYSQLDVQVELSPGIAGGNCTQVKDSQNSKCD